MNKKASTRFTEGDYPAVDAQSVDLLTGHTVDLQGTETRRDVPNVHESYVREFDAPIHSDTHATEQGHQFVCTTSPKPEAQVG